MSSIFKKLQTSRTVQDPNPLMVGLESRPCHPSLQGTLVYGAHFYVSMKGRAILGPPLRPHKLSNIYASLLEVVWWRTVEPLQSNGLKNICCRRGEPLPNAEWLPNSDPALSQAGTDLLGLIESQLGQCKCIVKPRTMSYSNGKQLVRGGMCS